MKAQILKIAGVKNEKEFYKKFPTEEAFLKKHGKQLKKAQDGMPIAGLAGITSKDISGIGNLITATKQDKLNSQLSGIAGLVGPIVGNVQDYNQTNRDIQKMNAYANVADVVKQASSVQNNPQPRKIDYNSMRSQTVNPLGVGTNYLQAENGAEIQNTYAPLDIYEGLGYEPLNDSNVKQFADGGGLNLDPFAGIAGTLGGNLGSATGKGTGRGGAASSIGSSLGGIAGNLLLPGVGGAVGSLVGGFAGGLIDSGQQNKMQEAQDRFTSNINKATLQSGAQAFQSQNSSFMEDGGWVSNDWMPQTITKFGDYSMDQLLAPPHDADMLRSGGHLAQVDYTAPSARAMYTGRDLPYQMKHGGQMAMGGDLQVHRGEAETLSYNPFLPNGGETIMFRGPSHDNGGMPITFGQNGVEVEGGEPAQVMQDGGEAENLVVFGNMVIPNYGIEELGDKKAKGKKFKTYVADLSKMEAKQNKIIDKSTKMVDNLDVATTFDKLSLQAAQANIMGATAKLKEIAEKKKIAANVQNSILDTAEEYGIVSDALAKGKIVKDKEAMKRAKFGAKMEAFQDGGTTEMADRVRFREIVESEMNKGGIYKSPQQIEEERLQDEQETAKLAQYRKTFDDLREEQNRIWGINPTPGIGPVVTSSVPAATATLKPAPRPTVKQFEKQIPFAERKKMALANGIKGFRGLPAQNKKLLDLTYQSASNPMMPAGTGVLANAPLPAFNMFKGINPGNRQYVPPTNIPVLGIKNVKNLPVNIPSSMSTPIVPYTGIPDEKVKGEGKFMSNLKNMFEGFNAQDAVDTTGQALSSLVNFIRPTSQQALDPSQLVPEMMALGMNQLEPVQAQLYNPMLQAQPYRMSLQDQRNEVIAQQRAAERMAYGNPAAAAMIAAETSNALNKINAEEFRANQSEAMRAAEANRAQMNDAQLKNLGILDQQFTRQAEARSKTKAQAIEVAKSVADKIAQNRLENRKQAIMENMYPAFSFTKSGVAYKNPAYLANLNTFGSGKTNSLSNMEGFVPKFEADESGRPKIVGYEVKKSSEKKNRNGGIVKAIKGL